MDDLERFYRQLVSVLAAKEPRLLEEPFPVLDVVDRFLPYAVARRSLGIENHQDYEMVVMRFAAGEDGWATTEPDDVAAKFSEESRSANPDTALFRHFPEATVQLARRRDPAPTPPRPASVGGAADGSPGESCQSCGGAVTASWQFCPHCGATNHPGIATFDIAVIAGDGIGPEVIAASLPVLDAAAAAEGFQCRWHEQPYSAEHYLATGETLPDNAFADLRDNYAGILVGALGDPRVPDSVHARDILLGLRQRLDLYINFRPIVLLHPSLTPLRDYRTGKRSIDFAIFRENTEGPYLGRGITTGDERIAEERITRQGVERIIEAAFAWAAEHGKGRVTLTDKSNAIPAHGLWREVFAGVADRYPDLESDHRYVDALALELVREPGRFDVIVASNLFGDILSDLGAGLVGGLGLAPSANLHPGRAGLFEPVHGSAPDIAGQGAANPLAAILTGALLFEAIGRPAAAQAIRAAVRRALTTGVRTPDLGGEHRTQYASDAVRDALA